MQHGFTLTEVLVSLILITGTSLALMNQQWLTSQTVNRIDLRMQALIYLDNSTEQLLADFLPQNNDERFQLHLTRTTPKTTITVCYPALHDVKNQYQKLSRDLVLRK